VSEAVSAGPAAASRGAAGALPFLEALRADVLRPDDLVGIAMYPADGDQAESLLQRTRNANRAFAMLAMLNLSIWGRPLTGEVRPA